MVRRISKLLKRPKHKVNWGNPPMIQKQTVDPSPCLDCGHVVPHGEHSFPLLGDICIAPERIKQMADDWTIATREGKRCKDFITGTQTKIGDYQ